MDMMLMIAEYEDGSYSPLAVVGSRSEADEMWTSIVMARAHSGDRSGREPDRVALWAQGRTGYELVEADISK